MELIRKIWDAWIAFLHLVGNLIGRLVLTLLYFSVVVPFALIVQLFSDPFGVKRRGSTYWVERGDGPTTLEQAREQA